MLADVPLFSFTLEIQEWQGKLWLCEICTYWNGIVEILEMVEIEGDL
jgi:hypothetical protein